MKKNILFVCIENSNRSQVAQAFAIIHGKEKVNVHSAGSKPSGSINSKAITAMKEVGYDLSVHKSKSLIEIPDVIYDYVITMGCGDECPFIIAHHREEWNIHDPRDMNEVDFRNVRDSIEEKVVSLLGKL